MGILEVKNVVTDLVQVHLVGLAFRVCPYGMARSIPDQLSLEYAELADCL